MLYVHHQAQEESIFGGNWRDLECGSGYFSTFILCFEGDD